MDWNKYGRVVASRHRKSVVETLSKGNRTPKEIAIAAKIPLSHVSNLLSYLTDEDLVVCLTPELKRGRIYSLTQTGKDIALALENQHLEKS